MSGRDHILGFPRVVLAFRILQLVTANTILNLTVHNILYLPFDGINLTLFTAISTVIIIIYVIVAQTGAPIIYNNYWAILGIDFFAIVFWISSFLLLAPEVTRYSIATCGSNDCIYSYAGAYYYKRSPSLEISEKRATINIYAYCSAIAAASGLWMIGIYLLRHHPHHVSYWASSPSPG